MQDDKPWFYEVLIATNKIMDKTVGGGLMMFTPMCALIKVGSRSSCLLLMNNYS